MPDLDLVAAQDQKQIWESYRNDLRVFGLEAKVFTARVRLPEETQDNVTNILDYDLSPYNTILSRHHKKNHSYWLEPDMIEYIKLRVKDDGFVFFLGEIDEARTRARDGSWIRIETNDPDFVEAHHKIKWKIYPNYAALLQETPTP